jgi:hypothetical protein
VLNLLDIVEIEMNYGIMRLEACRSVSVKCIWEIPDRIKKGIA